MNTDKRLERALRRKVASLTEGQKQLLGTLGGAGVGAGVGYLRRLLGPESEQTKRDYLKSMLSGAAVGGGTAALIPSFVKGLSGSPRPSSNELKEFAPLTKTEMDWLALQPAIEATPSGRWASPEPAPNTEYIEKVTPSANQEINPRLTLTQAQDDALTKALSVFN